MLLLNDVHSRLNPSWASRILHPHSLAEIVAIVQSAKREGALLIASGSRHAMGGQQFCAGGWVLDFRSLRHILSFDENRGLVEVEAGIEWPELIAHLLAMQDHRADAWSIVQKQTGADHLTIGGAVSANIHGRGLTLRPMEQDIEAITLVDASGAIRRCNRHTNAGLFRLVIGGYGLFGIIYSVQLRLARRHPVRRSVRMVRSERLMPALGERIADGFTYGDWQFAIDSASPDFLRLGVLSCYKPVARTTPVPRDRRALSESDWKELLYLAHVDKTRAFDRYSRHYLATDGQTYWSDLHQLSGYVSDYHREIDARLGVQVPGSEMITEVYVPRERLEAFLAAVRADLRSSGASVIYGTVRLIECDETSFLPWARQSWACVIFNLHVDHDAAAIQRAQDDFRGLIDRALECGGSFYLTYHSWATPAQVLSAHPRFGHFWEQKRRHDPDERFVSDWYLRYRDHFACLAAPSVQARQEVPI